MSKSSPHESGNFHYTRAKDRLWLYYTPVQTGKESVTQLLDSCDKDQAETLERNLGLQKTGKRPI